VSKNFTLQISLNFGEFINLLFYWEKVIMARYLLRCWRGADKAFS
jgi:hypothetical protein